MIYRRRKKDGNHAAIEAAYRAAGCSVFDASAVGQGFPDLVVGCAGQTVLVEIKNPKGRNRVEANQKAWHAAWRGGLVAVVHSVDEAASHIQTLRSRLSEAI